MTTRKNSNSKTSTKKKRTNTNKKSEQPKELAPLEPIDQSTDDSSKTLRFDAKAVKFLEGMQEKLGLESIHEVISTSFELLSTLATIEKSKGCHLAYRNEEGKFFPISLCDTDQNEAVLNTLKKQKEGNETSVEE